MDLISAERIFTDFTDFTDLIASCANLRIREFNKKPNSAERIYGLISAGRILQI